MIKALLTTEDTGSTEKDLLIMSSSLFSYLMRYFQQTKNLCQTLRNELSRVFGAFGVIGGSNGLSPEF